MMTLVAALAGPWASASAQSVFLNELHYDNTGLDADEAIEVVGPAGLGLSGWRLVLYNQDGIPYDTRELSGTLSDEGGGLGVAVARWPSNGIQNGPNDAVALVDARGLVIEFLSYEGIVRGTSGPAAGRLSQDIGVSESESTPLGSSLQRFGVGRDAGQLGWRGPVTATFGRINAGQSAEDSAPTNVTIMEVQGRGDGSPLEGLRVQTRGVVSAVFAGPDALGGFFVQDATGDSDAATSDGLFVRWDGSPPSLGEIVAIVGTVIEADGQTRLDAVAPWRTVGRGAVAPTPLVLPLRSAAVLEALEGMLVEVTQPLVVTGSEELAPFGRLTLSAGSRLFAPTNRLDPNDDPPSGVTFSGRAHVGAIAAEAARQALSTLVLDDASQVVFPPRVPALSSEGTRRLGDRIDRIIAVVDEGRGGRRLQPVESVRFDVTNPRPVTPPVVRGDLTVASFNVLNLFTTLGRRGADTAIELERQLAKTVAALVAIDADIVGLIEIENNGDDGASALGTLVAALNRAAGQPMYAAIRTPTTGAGTDEIRVALIYKPSRVRAEGEALGGARPVFERQPLAQTFRHEASGARFSVVLAHLKSKSGTGAGADADQQDGQGAFNAARVEQARALSELVVRVVAERGTRHVVVLGDLNAYFEEDPLDVLRSVGLLDVAPTATDDRYSYVFAGRAGALDHALVSPSLAPSVSDAAIWHINADEPEMLDYNLENRGPNRSPDFYAPTPYRSSDHDPLILGLRFGRP